jgi:carboxyl-terminal processing protease
MFNHLLYSKKNLYQAFFLQNSYYDAKEQEPYMLKITNYALRGILAVLFLFSPYFCEGKPADLTKRDVVMKMHEIMRSHVAYKKLTPQIAKRTLESFIDQLDPTKTYFLLDEIEAYLETDEAVLKNVVQDFEEARFPAFDAIFSEMKKAIARRNILEKKIDGELLPQNVTSKEFKDLPWCKTEEELFERLKRLRALQLDVAAKISKEAQDIALGRIVKRRQKIEEEYTSNDRSFGDRVLSTAVMKAMTSALDAHTNYFTPSEANQFLISVQQRLLGIGVQLRDDVDGFSIVKILEGGPAEQGGELKVKDKIIAINSEPVIGLDVSEVVELIRGQEGTQLALRIVRENGENGEKSQILKDIMITRGEVVLKESRLEAEAHPFGSGAIALIRLHAFYQDADTSSSEDVKRALDEIKSKYKVLGVILDLRFNAGGVLSQAVQVSGLFMKKGIVVSVKDENGDVHPLRDLDASTIWGGPLIVLINRGSASAAEIVAGALQDYGRALIVGDDHSFGKGSFQTFTLTSANVNSVDPQGEYKVTRGLYYTVSGKTPQLNGVQSDVHVASGLEYLEIGEMYAKYPLENDSIEPAFKDTLADVPYFQREKIRKLYGQDHQEVETTQTQYIAELTANSKVRQEQNKPYKAFLEAIKSNDEAELEDMDKPDKRADFQLYESMNVMKDLIIFLESNAQKAAA